MTDTTVTAFKPKDPTAALRARRARQKRKPPPLSVTAPATVSAPAHPEKLSNIKPSVTVAPALDVSYRVPWSVWPLAGTTVGLMAVSLTHLSDGVTQLTAIPSWQAWAMAVGMTAC